MTENTQNQIMDADQMRRAITRIAHEICERNPGARDLVLIGVIKRGDILARRIAEQIAKIESYEPPVGALDISFHRDDSATRRGATGSDGTSHLPVNVENKRVVLVDDVLFTGRSIRAAMSELIDYGRPRAVQLAVLIDRGHRELPIHADFVGKNVPTNRDQDIAVYLKERDPEDAVFLTSQPKARE